MRKNETCKKLCDSSIPATDAGFVNQAIQDRYALNWLIDGQIISLCLSSSGWV
jgi:transmembrane 9 superfamily protein 2/4